jgi:anti-anti-sigma factor
MEIEVLFAENIAHVKLRGRLDTPGVDKIESKFAASGVPGRNVVVDLREVSFIASMGLRMLIANAKQLRRRNARFVLFAPQAQVNEVFQTVRLREIVPVVADEAEAFRYAAS